MRIDQELDEKNGNGFVDEGFKVEIFGTAFNKWTNCKARWVAKSLTRSLELKRLHALSFVDHRKKLQRLHSNPGALHVFH